MSSWSKRLGLALIVSSLASAPLYACYSWTGKHDAGGKPQQSGTKHEAAEEEGAEHHGDANFNLTDFSGPFNEEHPRPYLAMLINFALLVGLYAYYGKKPIQNALVARRDAIAKEIEEAQRMKEEAEERAKVYQAKLGKLDDELKATKQALVEAGKGEKERIVREAEEKAARMRRDADFLIEQEAKQIRQDLWREAVDMAVSAADKLLREKVSAADHERLAEEYLADLAGKMEKRAG